MTRTTRAREMREGLGALLVVIAGLAGIPLVLVTVIGWPLPHHIPTTSKIHTAFTTQIPDSFWPKLFATLCWLAWCYFLLAVVIATVDVIRFRRHGTWRRAGGATATTTLISAMIVLASLRSAGGAGAISLPASTVALSPSPGSTGAGLPPVADPGTARAGATTPPGVTHTVVPGDTCWGIAEAYYGDGEDWPTIYNANVGLPQSDGGSLEATNWIYPGWKLIIPPLPSGSPTVPTVAARGSLPGPSETTYTVVPGDSLWSIAAAQLGSGEDWQTIYNANAGVAQADGRVLADPSLILPGWTLTLPGAPAAPTPATPPPPPAATVPAPPAATLPAQTPTAAGPAPAPAAPTVPAAPITPTAIPHHVGGGTPLVRTRPPLVISPTRHPSPDHGGNPTLPAEVIGGLGVLAAATIARSLVRRRRIARVRMRPGEMIAASSAPIRDLEHALAALYDTPTVDWLDLALRHLSEVDDLHPGCVPPVRLIRVGNSGVDLILADAAALAPGRFLATEGGWAWSLLSTTDPGTMAKAGTFPAWFSALVPVGEDDDGQTYLAPIEAGAILPVTGPGATEVLAAMGATAGSWPWASLVTVTDDPDTATTAGQKSSLAPGRQRNRVLFLGSPDALSLEALAAVGVVTTDEVAASDLSVLCHLDATVDIVPIQLRLRACRLTTESETGLAEAINIAERPPSPEVPEHRAVIGGFIDRDDPGQPTELFAVPARHPAPGSSELEVRVLTDTPRVAGLADNSVFARSGRHFELVALLALRGGLTKDQIRSAIYGFGSSVDRVSNIASQARQMLGGGQDGRLYLPAANSSGVLALSAGVTCDLIRLCQTADAALAVIERPAEAIALYSAALEIIDAAPGSAVDYTWDWWTPFAGIAEVAVTEAACNLSRLTIDAGGDFDAARAGIGRARAVAPYAEELYRSAIELAGASGNLGRATREWEALGEMLRKLDATAVPSPETEALYHRVMRRVTAAG